MKALKLRHKAQIRPMYSKFLFLSKKMTILEYNMILQADNHMQ
jgi:hypothetical protein